MNQAKRNSSAAIHIARRHQSAPGQHWADREVMKAAVEIDEGRWVAPTDDMALLDKLGIALGTGSSGVAVGGRPTLEDFQNTRQLNELGRHPRVVEAIEKLKLEVEQTENPQQRMEQEWALFEMTELQVKGNKWEGQQRWQGAENEAMRHGEVMSPWEFTERLFAVIGTQRVIRGGKLYKENESDASGVLGLYIRNPEWTGDVNLGDYPQMRAEELIDAGKREMREALQLRKAGHNAEADKKFHMAGEMGAAAGGLLMQPKFDQVLKPEHLRVGTLQWPEMTEWMVMRFDQFGVPVNPRFLGWRTALLTMIRGNAITEAEAHQVFPVKSGPAAAWYLEQLYRFRNPGAKRLGDVPAEEEKNEVRADKVNEGDPAEWDYGDEDIADAPEVVKETVQ